MTNGPFLSSVHTVVTGLLVLLVTGLSCFAFYMFRTGTAREQSLTDAMKVVRAATEIVASIAERGLPGLRGRVEELESRGRVLEQHQRKTGSVVESLARVVGGNAPPTSVPSTSDPLPSEAALLAARRAARNAAPA